MRRKTETWGLYVENGEDGGYRLNMDNREVREAVNYDCLKELMREACGELRIDGVVNNFVLDIEEDVKLAPEERKELELLVDGQCV